MCCVGSGLSDGLITRSEESYRMCVVCVCVVCVYVVCVCVWCAYVFYVPDNKILFIICIIKAQLCVIMTLEVTPICAATFLHDLSLI
jgi:hypothetical protein